MLDLNHILLFVACVSPLVLIAQGWRQGGMDRGWRVAAVAVLLVTGMSWIISPDVAGFVGGGAWLALILVPSLGLRKIAELTAQQRYAHARWIAQALRFVHPADRLRQQSELLRAFQIAQQGDFGGALTILDSFATNQTHVGRQATAQSFRIRADWEGLVRWFKTELPPGITQTDPGLQPLYLRALGETGARNELIAEYAENAGRIGSTPQNPWLNDFMLLPVLAFGGRHKALATFLETKLSKLSEEMKEFWNGVSQLAAGQTMAGRTQLQNLQAATADCLIRAQCTYRLERLNEISRVALSPAMEALLWRIEQATVLSGRSTASRTRPTIVVLLLIGLNLAMFVAETVLGGSTNPITLHRLGALEFYGTRFAGEYWRLFTSLFLHYGVLHLIFNLYALFIIGPGLERAIGRTRFTICYLLSGLGSGVGVMLLRPFGQRGVEQLVGASGCVMGLVGAWAGLLLRHRHMPTAGRRLKNILLIVAVQTAFDLSTPQVSMAAHMSGLGVGLLLGLILAPQTLRSRHL